MEYFRGLGRLTGVPSLCAPTIDAAGAVGPIVPTPDMPVLIRPVRVNDYAEILRINAEASPHVAELDEVELDRLVALARLAWVAEGARGVCGYLLAMDNTADYDGEEFGRFQEELDQPFVYIDQIAVDRGARRVRLASQMYAKLTQHGHVLCCEVNLDPPNPVSTRFHQRQGFRPLGEMRTCDGRVVALLWKPLPEA